MDSHNHPTHGGHEKTDVAMMPIIILLAVLALASVAAFVLMVPMFNHLEKRAAQRDHLPSPLADPKALPPNPRLQVTPNTEIEQYLLQMEEKLNQYRWIDRQGGTVQIPVDRAIDLLLERGFAEGPTEASQEPGQ